jgi:hypothetical protein
VASIAIRLVIIAVIVIGGIIFRDRLSGNATDLRIGDCFDDTEALEIKDVQHHPCTEAHTAEVVLVTDHTAAKGSAYPSVADFSNWADNTCIPAILSYVGPNADLASLDYAFLYPKESDWSDGERQMICYVTRLDRGTMSQSVRAASN